MISGSHPILTCEAAQELETRRLGGDEVEVWRAMTHAGHAIAEAVCEDFEELGDFPREARVLVLVGKGHNGGDALIAAASILVRFPAARVEVHFVFGERTLRPLVQRAWRELMQASGERITQVVRERWAAQYDICLDGVFGFQFRPPAAATEVALFEAVNRLPVGLRAAVDLPSAGLFRADFTYATGSVKRPVVAQAAAGRIRYLDLGFFEADAPGNERVLSRTILEPLRQLRAAQSDKRTYGHLFIVAGSRHYPGAALMAVQAALRSGVGLVTAFVPESMVSAFASQVPEAIWVGWPETPEGGLALEGLYLVRARESRATAFLIGPGIGREAETAAVVSELVGSVNVPVLLDADALQPTSVRAAKIPLVLTPHAGEFERIAGGLALAEFAGQTGATVVLKGPHTQVAFRADAYHSFFGGPVLARGGSGDLLAGIIGGLLAQAPADPLLAAARGVVWHGLAADLLARKHGQIAVRTTHLLDFLAPALRSAAR